VASTFSSRGT